MTSFSQGTNLSWKQIIILTFLTFIYLYHRLPVIYDDSPGYINFAPIRPPVYPIFIWLFHHFGQAQYQLTMWAQTIIAFCSLLYAGNWLHKRLFLSKNIIFCIICFCMLMFYYYRTFQLLCSEAIAFPLFIVSFLLLIDCFAAFSIKKMIGLCIFVNLLILTRLQFYYFYSFFILLLAWYLLQKIPQRNILICTLIMTSISLTGFGTNRIYHYLLNGHFAEAPVMGSQLVVQALYLSDLSAAQYFKNAKEKQIFTAIMQSLEEKRYTEKSEMELLPFSHQTSYAYYYGVYNQIMLVAYQHLNNFSLYEKDTFLLHMSKILYSNAIQKNVAFYLIKISSFFGGASIFLAFLMLLGGAIMRMLEEKIECISFNYLFIAVSLIFILLNTITVVIIEAGQASYFFYAYFLIFCLAGLTVKNCLATKLSAYP